MFNLWICVYWHGAWSPGVSGAVVAMGMPKGKEVDGAAMQSVDARVPGFVVMAANKDEGARNRVLTRAVKFGHR